MSENHWTPEQNDAIFGTGNLLVAAAAGSGKTAVLTARIVRLVKEGTGIDDLLVVTFTNAAAAEMKKRISKALTEAAGEETGEVAARLRSEALLVGRAHISTIHSFCLHLLRRHFYEAGLDPAFRTAEAAEALVLRGEALNEVLSERYESEQNEAFFELLRFAGGEKTLCDWIDTVYEYSLAQPEPELWLETAERFYREGEHVFEPGGMIDSLLAEFKEELKCALDALTSAMEPLETPAAHEVIDEELACIRPILLAKNYDIYRERLFAVSFGTLRFKRDEDPAVSEPVKAARNALKELIKSQSAALSRPLKDERTFLESLAPAMTELTALTRLLRERYGEKKTARALVDFSDMEHITLGLLKNEEIKNEYRERFKYVFVDEYQDSNRVQEAILSAVKREDNLFLVGDVKQSIYRFRLAEPALFLEKYDSFDGSETGRRIDLNANFRSAPEILSLVNLVFESVMTKALGEIDYDEHARLVQGKEQPKGETELHIIDTDESPDDAEPDDDKSALLERETAALEAMLAAERIQSLMREQGRHYSDFAVLLRSAKNTAETFVQTLSLSGIPAYAELTGGYFDAAEVAVMLNLARLIDNRRQDVPLVNVLLSPIGGFTADELAKIRIRSRDGSFFDALSHAAESGEEGSEKAAAFLEKLADWRKQARLMSVEELFGMLLRETGFYEFAGALPGGKGRQANLTALLTRAHLFENGGSRSLGAFLTFLDSVKSRADIGAAPTGGMDVVRVLSIHKSKGLQFPVVILAGLGKGFNTQDKSANLVCDDALGIGVRIKRGHRKLDTLFRRQIVSKQWHRQLAEEMRVLYVGMTRAENRLIMIATAGSVKKRAEKYRNRLSPTELSKCRGMLDWILYALLQTGEGNPIREYADLPLRGGAQTVKIRLYRGLPEVKRGGGLTKAAYSAWAEKAKQTDPEALLTRLLWKYPYPEAGATPTKVNASGGAARSISRIEEPAFLHEHERVSAAQRGTATHTLLQHIPFAAHTEQSIRAFASELVSKGLLTPEEENVISYRRVAELFSSPLGRRLSAAKNVERELQFNLLLPANELGAGESRECVMVQGVIDCCFLEGGEYVLLDYKTDYVPSGTSYLEAAEKHRTQVTLYARALTALTGVPVKEMHVYLLSPGADVCL